MHFDLDDGWLHKTDINPQYEDLLKEGDRKMMNKLQDIQILQACVKFLQDNLRGAVKMYKDEKERRQFAEKELSEFKTKMSDRLSDARKAGL